MAGAKLPTDHSNIYRFTLVTKSRITGDDLDIGNLGQHSQDILAQAIGEISLLGIARHVLKGEHSEHGDIFAEIPTPRRSQRLVVDRTTSQERQLAILARFALKNLHFTDKAQAFAMNGFDEAIRLIGVAQRCTQLAKLRPHCVWRGMKPIPYLALRGRFVEKGAWIA